MRLAQLARKIGIKPAEIAAFLADNNLPIEGSSNAKVEEDQVRLVFMHYAPDLLPPVTENKPPLPEEDTVSVSNPEHIEISEDTPLVESDEDMKVSTSDEDGTEKEVIKPVLVELPGLKVVGKIDLPESKKQEAETVEEDKVEAGEKKLPTKKTNEKSGRRRNVNRENEQRPRKNIVALQREREARETLKRKLEEKEREKKLRTERYLKKVSKFTPPPQRPKKIKHEDEYEVYSIEPEKPRSFFGKILNWFVSE